MVGVLTCETRVCRLVESGSNTVSPPGLNQLLWYYADMEKKRCTTGTSLTANGTLPDPDACIVWRRFAK